MHLKTVTETTLTTVTIKTPENINISRLVVTSATP